LRMLQHAQPCLHLPCLDLLVRWILHPEPSAEGCGGYPTCPGCLLAATIPMLTATWKSSPCTGCKSYFRICLTYCPLSSLSAPTCPPECVR
jgi:hypothetical protein